MCILWVADVAGLGTAGMRGPSFCPLRRRSAVKEITLTSGFVRIFTPS